MESLICNNTIEYIMKTIDFLRKVKHIRPTTEKIYNSIRKELNDKLDIVKYKTNIDYLIIKGVVEVRAKVIRSWYSLLNRLRKVRKNQVERPYRKQMHRRKYR